MPTTFKASNVSIDDAVMKQGLSPSSRIHELSKLPVEAGGGNAESLIVNRLNEHGPTNGFVQAVHIAYNNHLPLTLSPDDVWLCIAQGFGNHVNANIEALRQRMLPGSSADDPKPYIEIVRNGFVKGSDKNDWMGGFAEFSDKIAGFIGKKRDLLVGAFSTTGPIEKAVSEIVLMNSMKGYLSYGCRTMCGIPEITLLGTTQDWESVKDRAGVLAEFDCKDWVDSLVPVLNQFVQASKGHIDLSFWQSFYKVNGGSGGPYITGAINVLFPYLKNEDYRAATCDCKAKNPYARNWQKRVGWGGGPSDSDFPDGLCSVPFTWKYYSQEFKMAFLGGFVGSEQNAETKAVRPVIGWGVAETKE